MTANSQTEQGDRLAALGALAAGVLQELDVPLSFAISNQQHAASRLAALRELVDELAPSRRALALQLCGEIECAVRDSSAGTERARAIVSELKKLSETGTGADRERRTASAGSDPRARLLLVDDEPILLDALTRALEGHYAIDRATSALAALERCAAGNEYDLIVCDLMMPQMSGMDLFRALEQRFPRAALRTAFMTGGAFTLPAQEFIAAAGRRVLEKPFSNDELFAFVAACLNLGDARRRTRFG